jgi:hypothetical protein
MSNLVNLFQEHPLISGIGLLATLLAIFNFIGFKENELRVIAFIISIILIVIYFDSRIEKLENKFPKEDSKHE